MPYVTNEKRLIADDMVRSKDLYLLNDGDITYVITKIIHQHLENMGGLSYHNLNRCVGILQNTKDEFNRSVVAKYEDSKKELNGGVSKFDS